MDVETLNTWVLALIALLAIFLHVGVVVTGFRDLPRVRRSGVPVPAGLRRGTLRVALDRRRRPSELAAYRYWRNV